MKIVIVTDAWLPQINGVVTTYIQTIKELRSRGHEVVTITPERFRTVCCPTYPEIPLALARPSTIRGMLLKSNPHSVHIATEGPLGWAARRVCIKDGVAFTTAYHTRFPEYVRLRFPLPLRLSYSVMRVFHNKSKRIMVSSAPLKKELEAKGFKDVCLWARGVDTQLFRPRLPDKNRSNEKTFTFLGRVAPEKNIEAFLKLKIPGRKVVIGDGPALKELKAGYPDVFFTGYKKGKELAEQLAESDVFVFPSLTDTFGVVQLEAMACGVPVAAYPANGPKAVIQNGYNGWIDEDLTVAVTRCLDISRQNCREYALAHTWKSCTDQFISNLIFQPDHYSGTSSRFLEKVA